MARDGLAEVRFGFDHDGSSVVVVRDVTRCNVVILAGGLGTRCARRPAVPKALLPVAGEPFVAHQLELLRRGGVREVVYCIGHLGDQVRDGRRRPATVRAGRELRRRGRGAARHRRGAAPRRPRGRADDEFLVLYADSYLPIDFRTVRAASPRCPRTRADDGLPQRRAMWRATWSSTAVGDPLRQAAGPRRRWNGSTTALRVHGRARRDPDRGTRRPL